MLRLFTPKKRLINANINHHKWGGQNISLRHYSDNKDEIYTRFEKIYQKNSDVGGGNYWGGKYMDLKHRISDLDIDIISSSIRNKYEEINERSDIGTNIIIKDVYINRVIGNINRKIGDRLKDKLMSGKKIDYEDIGELIKEIDEIINIKEIDELINIKKTWNNLLLMVVFFIILLMGIQIKILRDELSTYKSKLRDINRDIYGYSHFYYSGSYGNELKESYIDGLEDKIEKLNKEVEELKKLID